MRKKSAKRVLADPSQVKRVDEPTEVRGVINCLADELVAFPETLQSPGVKYVNVSHDRSDGHVRAHTVQSGVKPPTGHEGDNRRKRKRINNFG